MPSVVPVEAGHDDNLAAKAAKAAKAAEAAEAAEAASSAASEHAVDTGVS